MIETRRLLLRPMRPEDVDDLLLIFTDPNVMASFGDVLFDRAQMERWIGRNLEHQARHGYGLFSVIHKADNLLIGDCGSSTWRPKGPRRRNWDTTSAATTGTRGWRRKPPPRCATTPSRCWGSPGSSA